VTALAVDTLGAVGCSGSTMTSYQ